MYRVKIYGAGSIGNHLANAFRGLGWAVSMCDTEQAALDRTKHQIYPARYGRWDEDIRLATVEDLLDEPFEVVAIGTPPDTHVEILLRELEKATARVILVEKPLCGPGLEGCAELVKLARDKGIPVCVGYNHVLTRNTALAAEFIRNGGLGTPQTMGVTWVEHWGGIFAAHPWLDGPADSYLGDASRGGGACGEHSHGINIWQHFAYLLGVGKIAMVSAVMERVTASDIDYDQIVQINVMTEKGFTGYIIQDVVSRPALKLARIQGTAAALEWRVNSDSQHDEVRYWERDRWREERIPKKRPDDFVAEANHLSDVVDGNVQSSPLSLERGLETMMVIAAANKSAKEGRQVTIDYEAGYVPEALVLM